MDRYDVRLVAPSANQLLAALTQATDTANRELVRLPDLDGTFWADLLPSVRAEASGRHQWEDLRWHSWTVVGLAWWTDRIGRRHFRVYGGQVSHDDPEPLYVPPDDPRPPLAHIYPDAIYRRTLGEAGGWVAACACGEVGPPEQLGWMGTCCAVCHDRGQEQGDTPSAPTVLRDPGAWGLTFDPDGRSLLTWGPFLRRWDLRRGVPVWERPWDQEVQSVAVADGGLLAVGEGPRLDVMGGLHQVVLFDTAEDRELWRQPAGFAASHFALAAHGLALALAGPNGLEVWERPGREAGPVLARQDRRPHGQVAFDAAGERLAVSRSEPETVEVLRLGGREVEFLPLALGLRLVAGSLRFTPDGRQLQALACEDQVGATSARLLAWGLDRGREAPRELWRDDTATDDGRLVRFDDHTLAEVVYVEAPNEDGRSIRRGDRKLFGWALGRPERRELLWNPQEELIDLALSPDGQTLASLGERGTIKLWPWRRLLEV